MFVSLYPIINCYSILPSRKYACKHPWLEPDLGYKLTFRQKPSYLKWNMNRQGGKEWLGKSLFLRACPFFPFGPRCTFWLAFPLCRRKAVVPFGCSHLEFIWFSSHFTFRLPLKTWLSLFFVSQFFICKIVLCVSPKNVVSLQSFCLNRCLCLFYQTTLLGYM